MVFNADTYYANKYRRRAWEVLAAAREVKARIASEGLIHPSQTRLIEMYVRDARLNMRLHLLYRSMKKRQA